MPLIDLPLSQLETYAGKNPKPADHDEYWRRALAEMQSVDAKLELVAAEFQTSFAECFHLYFTGVRGARIHAKYLRPTQAREACRVIVWTNLVSPGAALGGWLGPRNATPKAVTTRDATCDHQKTSGHCWRDHTGFRCPRAGSLARPWSSTSTSSADSAEPAGAPGKGK